MFPHKFVYTLCTCVAMMTALATLSSTNAQAPQFKPDDCVKTGWQGTTLYVRRNDGSWRELPIPSGHVFRVDRVQEDQTWLLVHDRPHPQGLVETTDVYRVDEEHCTAIGI